MPSPHSHHSPPGARTTSPAIWAALILLGAASALLATAATGDAGPFAPLQSQREGRIRCTVKENGAAASGTAIVENGSGVVARGECDSPISVPPGSYQVRLKLDGVLDEPEQTRPATVRGGEVTQVAADFSTGILEIVVEAKGRRAAGMAVIRREGDRVGTVGSGVAAHLSAGTYSVTVRYRTQEKKFDAVELAAGQRRRLRANF